MNKKAKTLLLIMVLLFICAAWLAFIGPPNEPYIFDHFYAEYNCFIHVKIQGEIYFTICTARAI